MSVLSLIPEDKKKDFDSSRKESLESVYSSNSRLSLLQKRKKLIRSVDMSSNQSLNGRGDRYVTQRVLSAKTHRVKQLQNQLADAHYHLQELSNENRVLKALQKKYEVSLSRYENSNADLPQVLNSHSEEMRIQIAKYKQLKQQYKEISLKLKERDLQLQQLRDEHQHLSDLSRDRNLPEREKLQTQVLELTQRVEQQNSMINMLQRKVALEAKNYKYQLQVEISKHKDTRHDLDLAISNADKLSNIIEMKEKMLPVTFVKNKSPKPAPPATSSTMKTTTQRPLSKTIRSNIPNENTGNTPLMDSTLLAKLCENSRSLSSALSHEEDTTSSNETRLRSYSRSRSSTARTTPNQTRKNSKESDEIIELAKTVQDGMSDMSMLDNDIDFKNTSPDEMQKKIETMKADLINKIKRNEDPVARLPSALRRYSTDKVIDEREEIKEVERPKSRSLRSGGNVSFFGDINIEETTNVVTVNNYGSGDEGEGKPKSEHSNLERKLSGKPVEKYCKDIIHDIEKSSRVIDKHMKDFNNSKFESDHLVQQLEAVDKISDFVAQNSEIPDDSLVELNNNFKMLATQSNPVSRKRSIGTRRTSIPKAESRNNLFGDASMSNQDLLNDLLGNN